MKINFGANLETIRKSKKISQEELAELIGVSRQTYISFPFIYSLSANSY